VLGLIGNATGGGDQTTDTATQPSHEGISQGAGTKDASADVELLSFRLIDDGYGNTHHKGTLRVTNHSSKPSDYYIELSIENRAGENIGWTNALVDT
jgi:hypothetical protein